MKNLFKRDFYICVAASKYVGDNNRLINLYVSVNNKKIYHYSESNLKSGQIHNLYRGFWLKLNFWDKRSLINLLKNFANISQVYGSLDLLADQINRIREYCGREKVDLTWKIDNEK